MAIEKVDLMQECYPQHLRMGTARMKEDEVTKELINKLCSTSGTKPIIVSAGHVYILMHQREKEEVPFSMAIGNRELMHECFPKHSRMGTARMK